MAAPYDKPVISNDSPFTPPAHINNVADFAEAWGRFAKGTTTERAALLSTAGEGDGFVDTTEGNIYLKRSGSWAPIGPFGARAVRRKVANLNQFTAISVPTQLPNGTDKAAADTTFVKRYSSTRLIVRMDASWVCTSLPAEQPMFMLLSINSSTPTIAELWMNLTGTRYSAGNTVELAGIPAGTYTVGPRFQSGGTANFEFAAGRDVISYSITEAI